jgi:hypothetical protein
MGLALGLITVLSTVGGTAWLFYSAKTTAEQRAQEMEQLARTADERRQIEAQVSNIKTQIFLEQMKPVALVGIPVMAGLGALLLHKMKQQEQEIE